MPSGEPVSNVVMDEQSVQSVEPAFGMTLRQLNELMKLRGDEQKRKIAHIGGSSAICQHLNTSPSEGTNGFYFCTFFSYHQGFGRVGGAARFELGLLLFSGLS